MKKPWNKQPTPQTDEVVAKSLNENGGQFMTEDLLFHARNLERRLRRAEKLLYRLYAYYCSANRLIEPQVGKHFAASAQEDAK
jgi:hypothetical protein